MQASEYIDNQIKENAGWKGEKIKILRRLIHEADPKITEEWKWGTGVWSHNGMVCAIGVFKTHVKINFFKGAKLTDKNKIINAGLDSKQHRSVDFGETDSIPEQELKELIQEAVSLNQ